MNYKAYLIVICDTETNAILGATIWSSPEWEQSRCITATTYVAYAADGQDFHTAKMSILERLNDPRCRYHRFLRHLGNTPSDSEDEPDLESIQCSTDAELAEELKKSFGADHVWLPTEGRASPEVPGQSHTPGPWRVGSRGHTVVADNPAPGINGSDAIEYYGGHMICESVNEPNAHLIAAAPTMLTALLEVRDIMTKLGDEYYLSNFAFVEESIAAAHGAKP